MSTTALLVMRLLESPDRFRWTVQGLGMLRAYLSPSVRLHIWHSAFEVPGVSSVHDHPWDFESEIVSGRLLNHRYGLVIQTEHGPVLRNGVGDAMGACADPGAPNYVMQPIRCGEGGGPDAACELGEAGPCSLWKLSTTEYQAGDTYSQFARDIHNTVAVDGTVTLVTRRFKKDTEHARVFFPVGTEWVSAEPRNATVDERVTGLSAARKTLETELLPARRLAPIP
jgi:hypothetical protein